MGIKTLGNIAGSGTVASDGKLGARSGRWDMTEQFIGKARNSSR